MSLSLNTARYLAPASFICDLAAQLYGINSTPSMMDVNNRNLSFFSPHPYFIAGFFFTHQLFQLAWLYKLWKLDANNPKEKKELGEMVRFAPYYVLVNLSLATWTFFWISSHLKIADIFVIINTVAQLYYVFTQLAPMNTASWPSILTHVVSIGFAGLSVLDILHNTSIAWFKDETPGTVVKVLTGLGFAGLSACSDWIFGGCLVYDLVGISAGQASYDEGWSKMLGAYAVGSVAIVAVRNYVRPPYVKSDYEELAGDETNNQA